MTTRTIEQRLDAIIELLVLLVNQTERQVKFSDSFLGCMVLDNAELQGYSTVFRPNKELLAAVAAAVEAVKRDLPEQQEPPQIS